MSENKHTISDLHQMQALPLSAKIRMTQNRIRAWYEHWNGDVYVSFSGGKDSTVLLDIVRNRCGFKDVPAVFVDVPTQYPELRDFAKQFDNLIILYPKKNFKQICEQYGFPMVSKQVARYIEGARRWKANNPDGDIKNATVDYKIMFGKLEHKENGVPTNEYSKMYNKSKYAFMVDAPFNTSAKCCHYMKKEPLKKYAKETGRKPITGQMASESHLRAIAWQRNGCNAFESNEPISNPMSFWTEQDVLLYIKQNSLRICSVYGEIVDDLSGTEEVSGQMTISDLEGFAKEKNFDAKRLPLKTSGCDRTGCVLCGFGACMSSDDRYIRLKQSHPKLYSLLDVMSNNGVTMREALEWMNEHGNLKIRY